MTAGHGAADEQDEAEAPVDVEPSPAQVPPRPESSAASTDRRFGLPARQGAAEARGAGDRIALETARRVVDLASDKKASDIVLLDVSNLTTVADYFVICSGGSERQLNAIADGIAEGLKKEGVLPVGREGAATAHWVLMDLGSVIVHIFAPPERDYYQLERLWSEAPLLLRVQ